MASTLERIAQIGVVPVIVITDPADAPALLGALSEGGLPIAEFTFRTDAAVEAIAAAASAYPDALVGAGSVLFEGQVEAAVEAGASFVVSPGFESGVVRRTQALGAAPLPGCATSSDLMAARQLGLEVVKFHPSEMNGGLPMIRALAAPFPGLRFVPSGGVNLGNLEDYLAEPRVMAVGGSWMAKTPVVTARDWGAITQAARAAVAAVKRARERG
jgi:2-dehydro-3-deoxyphosphogluconate aldolase/(4S)-4-hydroxy-2-oxoglutarate aldolase